MRKPLKFEVRSSAGHVCSTMFDKESGEIDESTLCRACVAHVRKHGLTKIGLARNRVTASVPSTPAARPPMSRETAIRLKARALRTGSIPDDPPAIPLANDPKTLANYVRSLRPVQENQMAMWDEEGNLIRVAGVTREPRSCVTASIVNLSSAEFSHPDAVQFAVTSYNVRIAGLTASQLAAENAEARTLIAASKSLKPLLNAEKVRALTDWQIRQLSAHVVAEMVTTARIAKFKGAKEAASYTHPIEPRLYYSALNTHPPKVAEARKAWGVEPPAYVAETPANTGYRKLSDPWNMNNPK